MRSKCEFPSNYALRSKTRPRNRGIGEIAPDEGPSQVTQLHRTRCALDAQKAVLFDVVAVEEFLATHVLVACGDIAFTHRELPRPAWDGVFVKADEAGRPRINCQGQVWRQKASTSYQGR